MNAGQIFMSIMQDVSTSVTPDAAVTAGGEQMPDEGGFSGLLAALQTEAQQLKNVPETGSETVESEAEPVTLRSERITDVTQGCPELCSAGTQLVLAAYAQPVRLPDVNTPPRHDVDAVQDVPPAPVVLKAEQAPFASAASAKAQAFEVSQTARQTIVEQQPSVDAERPAVNQAAPVEMLPQIVEAAVQRQLSTPPQQDGRMPVVNTLPPSQDVDVVQNVQPAAPVQQTEQTPVTAAVPPKPQVFEPLHVQTVRQAAAVSEQHPARPVMSAPVETTAKTVEANLQRQPAPSTPPQQDGRTPAVNTPPSHDVDAVQNAQPATPVQQTEQTPVTAAVPPKPRVFEPLHVQTVRQAAAVSEQHPARPVMSAPVETTAKTVEANLQRQPAPSTPPQQDGRTPDVNTPPSHDVDAVQNAQPAAPLHVQTVRQAAAVSEQHSARPVMSAPVETTAKTVEANLQRQPAPSTPPQQDGRMPVVNTLPPSQDVDAVQNAQPAAPVLQTEQTPVTAAVPPKPQVFEPLHVQTVRQAAAVAEQHPARPVMSAPIETTAKTVEANLQRQPAPSTPPQQDGRMPVVNTLPPSQDVDVVQDVAAEAPKHTLEEIAFSLARPISISRNHSSEQNRIQQTAFVDRPHIISLDMDSIQSRPSDIQSTHELPEGVVSVRSQHAVGKATASTATNPEPLPVRKEQPLVGMPVLPAETASVKPEMVDSEKETADVRAASLQRPLHGAPAQIAVGTRLESEKQSTTPALTKEDLLVQQNAKPVGEASLAPDDSRDGNFDQAGSDQNPDARMMTSLVHGQAKPEHQNVAPVSDSKIDSKLSGQELPERVAHQVRERLNQHEVKQGSQQITLTLSPENLGELKMSLNLQGQRLSVEILTENRLVRDAILQHSDSLKESLARQNIAVESFDVTANGRGSGNSGHNQDAWKELARQKQQQHFWSSNSGYHPEPLESQKNPLAYRAGNEQAMLDIHY